MKNYKRPATVQGRQPALHGRLYQVGSSLDVFARLNLPVSLFKGMIFPRKGERDGG